MCRKYDPCCRAHRHRPHLHRYLTCPRKTARPISSDRQIYFGGGCGKYCSRHCDAGRAGNPHLLYGRRFYRQRLRPLDEKDSGSTSSSLLSRMPIRRRRSCSRTMTGDQMTFFEWGASKAFATADAPPSRLSTWQRQIRSFNCRVAERSEFVSFDPGQDVFWYTKEQLGIDHRQYRYPLCQPARGAADVRDAWHHERCNHQAGGTAIFTMSGDGSTLYTGGERDISFPSSRSHLPIPPVQVTPTGPGSSRHT